MFKYHYRIKFTSGFFAGIYKEMNLNLNLDRGRKYPTGYLFETTSFEVLDKFESKE